MVVLTLFLIQLEENVWCWEKPISIDSVRQSRFADMFFSEFSFQNLFWYFLVKLYVQATKTLKFVFNKPYHFQYAFLLVKLGCFNTINRWILSIDLVSDYDHHHHHLHHFHHLHYDHHPFHRNLYNHMVSTATLWK